MNKELKYYTVKLDILVPAELSHSVLASSPEEALEKTLKENQPIKDLKYLFHKRKQLNISVYENGTFTLYIKKNL